MRRIVVGLVALLLAGGVLPVGEASADAATAPGAPTGVASSPLVGGVLVSWTAPVSDGGSPLTGFVVTPSVGDPMTIDVGISEAVVNADPGITVSATVEAVNDVGHSAPVAVGAVTATAPGGVVRAGAPKRLVDSRYGTGVAKGKLAANAERLVQVTGRAGVPTSGVASVFVNVMALDVVANTSLSVYPDGTSVPGTSSIVAVKAERIIQLVEVKVGTGGRIRVHNGAGSTNLVLDVLGYSLTPAASGVSTNGLVTVTSPTEVLNTRTGVGVTRAKVGAAKYVTATVLGRGGVPATGVAAVFVNLTAYGPTTITGLTVYPAGPLPGTQNLSAVPGVNRTNRVLVPVAPGGKVQIYNQYGTVDVKLDLAGWVADGSDPGLDADSLNAQSPARLVDTRVGTGTPKKKLAKGAEITVTAAGSAGVPAMTATTPTTAVLAFVHLFTAATTTSVSLRPAATTWVSVADVTGRATQTMSNLVLVPVSRDGKITIRSSPGSTGDLDVVVDIVGWIGGSTVLSPFLKVLSAADAARISGVDTDGYTLAASAPAVPKIGDVISAGITPTTPDGLLRRVEHVATNSGGSHAISTRPAAFTEGLRRGSLARSSGGAGTSSPGPDDRSRTDRRVFPLPTMIIPFNPPMPAGVTVSGQTQIDATLEASIDLGWSGEYSALFAASATIQRTATMHADSNLEVSVEAPIIDLPMGPPIVVIIGPMWIILEPVLQGGIEASIQTNLETSIGYSQTETDRFGMQVDDGVLSPIVERAADPPTFTAPKVDVDFQASLGGTFAPVLQVDGEVDFGAIRIFKGIQATTSLDTCTVRFKLVEQIELGFSVSLFHFGVQQTVATIPLLSLRLGDVPIPGCTPPDDPCAIPLAPPSTESDYGCTWGGTIAVDWHSVDTADTGETGQLTVTLDPTDHAVDRRYNGDGWLITEGYDWAATYHQHWVIEGECSVTADHSFTGSGHVAANTSSAGWTFGYNQDDAYLDEFDLEQPYETGLVDTSFTYAGPDYCEEHGTFLGTDERGLGPDITKALRLASTDKSKIDQSVHLVDLLNDATFTMDLQRYLPDGTPG